jgi:hypothetical protein
MDDLMHRVKELPPGSVFRARVAGRAQTQDLRVVAQRPGHEPVVELVNADALTGQIVPDGDWHPVGPKT